MEYGHGGDIYAFSAPMLDFSANMNPLGAPEAVRRAAAEAAAAADRYPDPLCRELTAAIAVKDGVSPENVLCGGGAADLIYRFALALSPRRALVTAPAFSEYARALKLVNCAVMTHKLRPEEDFDLTGGVLEAIGGGLDALFLCNPNNPTGRLISPALLEQIAGKCREKGVILALDECFLPLSDGWAGEMGRKLKTYPNLLIFRAFTKTYAVPGLRLGYCLSENAPLLEKMARSGPPWAVSAPAQAAGIAALALPDWPARARAYLKPERERLLAAFSALGLKVCPGTANYLLFQAPGVTDLREKLAERGVLIRSCADYGGLGGDWYRIAVKRTEENEILLKTLREVL